MRRSYNILKEVKRPQDIDNTYVISLIERKNDQRRPQSLGTPLLPSEVGTVNVKSSERDGQGNDRSASLRSSNSQNWQPHSLLFNVVGISGHTTSSHDVNKAKNQCHVGKANHYVDECPRFQAMTPNERWEVVKEQKACFSCWKRGKGHTTANCLRKKECSERNGDSTICKRPHHKLLHTRETSGPVRVNSLQDKSKTLLLVITGAVSRQCRLSYRS